MTLREATNIKLGDIVVLKPTKQPHKVTEIAFYRQSKTVQQNCFVFTLENGEKFSHDWLWRVNN